MSEDLAGLREQIAAHGGLVVPLDVETLAAGYTGCYPSATAYLRQEIEPFVDPCILWLLDCVDWTMVRRYFSDLHVLPLNDGAVLVLRREGAPIA